MKIDLKKIKNVQMDNVKTWDYPDFSDAMVVYGEIDGKALTDEQLDYINENCQDFVNEKAHEKFH